MAKKCFLFYVLTCCFMLAACESESVDDGKWTKMKITKVAFVFPSDGGMDSCQVKNYKHWWIADAYSNDSRSGERAIVPLYPFDTLQADWFTAVVPKGNANWLLLETQPNETGLRRRASLLMTAGDIFKTITIEQNP